MSPVSPARRRANEFASLIEGRGERSESYAEALELVAMLRATPAPVPSEAYVRDLRGSLMAAAETLLQPTEARLTLPQRTAGTPRRRERRIAIAVGALAMLGSTTGVAFAAQNALPGDALYPVKRILESAQTSLSPNEEARAARIMDLAHGRLDEAEALALRDSAEAQAAIPQALEDFVAQASQVADALLADYSTNGDTSSVVELREFTRDSLDVLAGLKSMVPAEFADAFDAAVNALLSIDERAMALCADCGGLLDIPAILLSGATTTPVEPQAKPVPPAASAPARTTNSIVDLLNQVPPLGSTSTTTPAPAPTLSPSPSPTGTATDPTGLEGLTDPLLDPLGGLLSPLLGPLLGSDGLL